MSTFVVFVILIVILIIIVFLIDFLDRVPTGLKDIKTGYDYERYCAARLEEVGWRCTVTQAGDRGVDMIATKGGIRAAIQCNWKNAVGNKAVQEIVAGAMYVRADVAVVIASSRCTDSAIALARKTSVLLLTHDDIPSLQKKLASRLGKVIR